MGEMCLKNAYVLIGSTGSYTALSTFCRSVTINYGAEMLDRTAMGSSGRKRLAGLKDWSLTLELNQDYAASQVDATLFPLVGSTAKQAQVRPTTSITGAANPKFVGKCHLESYSPISGSVGNLGTVSVTFPGHGVMTRSVAAT